MAPTGFVNRSQPPLPHPLVLMRFADAAGAPVGTLVSFRIGKTDAEVLSREFGETFPPANFVDLDRYEVLVKLMENGANPEPFRARTLAPIENRVGKRDKLIARSREKYAASRANVEAKIERWLAEREADPRRIRKGRIPFLPVRL